jgi:hypothetical protein
VRRPTVRLLVALTTAVWLTGSCTGDADSTDRAEASAGARLFCDEATAAFRTLTDSVAEAGDVEALPAALDRAATDLDGVAAPADIAADWETVRAGYADLREQISALDFSAAGVEEEVSAVFERSRDTGAAFERVVTYVDEHCPGQVAPPT